MNRLGFLKRLIGGVVAAPLVAKAIAEEKPKLEAVAVPSFRDYYSYLIESCRHSVSTHAVDYPPIEWQTTRICDFKKPAPRKRSKKGKRK